MQPARILLSQRLELPGKRERGRQGSGEGEKEKGKGKVKRRSTHMHLSVPFTLAPSTFLPLPSHSSLLTPLPPKYKKPTSGEVG